MFSLGRRLPPTRRRRPSWLRSRSAQAPPALDRPAQSDSDMQPEPRLRVPVLASTGLFSDRNRAGRPPARPHSPPPPSGPPGRPHAEARAAGLARSGSWRGPLGPGPAATVCLFLLPCHGRPTVIGQCICKYMREYCTCYSDRRR